MKYYMVIKPEKVIRFRGYVQTIASELFTPSEFRRYCQPDKYGFRLRPEWVKEVEIPKNKTYWFFGARFPFHEIRAKMI